MGVGTTGGCQTTRVCAYDRAGMGWSAPGTSPRDARQIATDLHALLRVAQIQPPYVLVGHSLGGLFVRQYAAQYSEDVAAVVLVDATHPDFWKRLPRAVGGRPADWQLTAMRLLARFGLIRAGLVVPFPVDATLPDETRAQIVALNNSTQAMQTMTAELAALPGSLDEVRATLISVIDPSWY